MGKTGAMTTIVLSGSPPVPVVLRRSARARRLSLRISGLDGRVTLTLPPHAHEDQARDFVQEKETWIRTHLARQPARLGVCEGTEIPFCGQTLRVELVDRRSVCLEGARLLVPRKAPGARTAAFLKLAARDALAAASDRYAAALGRPYKRLVLRDTRSRWGSCSSNGTLMYSWRLIMAPRNVADYVAAHEVAHLCEMNHSRAFWALVAELCPGYQAHRLWLRENGAALHAIRFDD